MHSRARGAFAQVIEQADELHLGAVGVRQAEDLQPVQPGQLIGSQEATVGTLVQRMDRDHLLPCVIVGQGTGHLLGGAGGIEAVFTALALRDQFAPPTIHYEQPDPECDLDYVPNVGRAQNMTYALSNSLGWHGC